MLRGVEKCQAMCAGVIVRLKTLILGEMTRWTTPRPLLFNNNGFYVSWLRGFVRPDFDAFWKLEDEPYNIIEVPTKATVIVITRDQLSFYNAPHFYYTYPNVLCILKKQLQLFLQ